MIFDKNLQTIDKVAGPFDEDSSVSLICDASEGKLENAIKRPMSQFAVMYMGSEKKYCKD